MQKITIFLVFCLWMNHLQGQDLMDIDITHRCAFTTIDLETELFSFPANSDVQTIVSSILQESGDVQNFEIIESNVENVVAVNDKGRKYLLYSHDFLQNLKDGDRKAILAHAIAHLVNEDALPPDESDQRKQEELRAEYFAGYTLGKMGFRKADFKSYLDVPYTYQTLTSGQRSEEILKGNDKADESLQMATGSKYMGGSEAISIPQFPSPIPTASATMELGDKRFVNCKSLGETDKILQKALKGSGYYDKSYYRVPGGYALVTRLEQTNADGSPKPEGKRWQARTSSNEEFSLEAYLKSLFVSNVGYFRILVFIVSDKAYLNSGQAASREEALAWLSKGANKLPNSIKQIPFNDDYSVQVLVYEFVVSDNKKASTRVPGQWSAKTHLQKAQLNSLID